MKRKPFAPLMSFSLGTIAVLAIGISSAVLAAHATPSPAPSATPTVVTIKDFAFTPKVVSIPIGGSVTWKNLDLAAHTVTDASTHAFDSGNLPTGKTYTFTFSKPGVYKYVCAIHASMVATVLVGPNATIAPTPAGGSDESEGPDHR